MAHYVVTIDGTEYVVGEAWSERDAIESAFDKAGKDWQSADDLTADAIRPATVREALTAQYGEDWEQSSVVRYGAIAEVTKRTWFEYVKAGEPYSTGYQPMRHVWHEAPIIVVNHTRSNDTFGYEDPTEVANYRVLADRWSELAGLSDGPYSNCKVIALDLDEAAPEDLIDVLESLEAYPVLDDEEWSRVEQEMIQEHWESYGQDDVLDAVAKAIGADNRTDLSDNAREIVGLLVWGGILDYGDGGGYPTMADSSACDFGYEDVAEFISQHLGEVVTVKPHNGYGDAVSLDLTRENLIEA